MLEEVSVVAAIIESEGLVLIARRPERGRHPGRWEFPGGKVEPGERLSKCAEREMAEEMALKVRALGEIATVRHEYPDLCVELHAVRCEVISGEPEDIGCDSHAWVEPLELERYDLLPPDRELAKILFPS